MTGRRRIAQGSGTPDDAWYVVQTQPNREPRAAHELEAQGYTVFLPRYLRKCRHARRITMAAGPLFPGYLFVKLSMTQQHWRPINGTVGVIRLITTLERPATVARGVVEALIERCGADGLLTLQSRPAFAPGEIVRVSAGNFAHALGLFDETKDNDRIAILLDLLGRKVRVVLDEGMVEKAA